MLLAPNSIPLVDFDKIHAHLLSHPNGYRNMHLRAPRIRQGKRTLRYFHVLRAGPGGAIEGMIAGPSIFIHYEIMRTPRGVQANIRAFRCPPKELSRLQRRFLPELLARVDQEAPRSQHSPKRLPNEIYLRRCKSPPTALDVSASVLDPAFVAALPGWELEVIRGR